MKKIIISILLAVSIMLSSVSCAGNKAEKADSKLEYTDYPLVENGKTEYKIIIGDDAGNMTQYGAQEFASFFEKATNTKIDIEITQKSFTEHDSYICIGENSYSKSADLDFEKESLDSQGYHIETKGKSIFVYGGGDKGNLYGVYDLLEKLFDLEFYSNDEVSYTQQHTMNVPKLCYSEEPDFDIRIVYTGQTISDSQFQQYLRTVTWENAWTGVGGAHTSYKLIDVDREEHPEWFARKIGADGTVEEYKQLCFTNEEMIQQLTENVIAEIQKYPDRENVMVGIEDNRNYCECPDCQKMMEQYGGCASASVIKVVNRIAEDVKQYLDETKQEREVTVVMFAYYGYLEAPVKKDADGKWIPIDDSVALADNAAVMIAPIDSDFAHSYYETETNNAERESFEKWNALSDSIYLWTYTTNFAYMLCPFDTFNAMQENFQFWKEHDVKYLYCQGQYGNMQGTGFIDLQTYLQSKLLWDVDADVELLTDNYFEYYFREAAAPMRQYFEELKLHFAYLREEKGVNGGIYFNFENKEYWSFNLLQAWEDDIQKAYEAIAIYEETDPELYLKLKERICLESIAIRHLTATLHKGMFNDADYNDYTTALKDDMNRLKISRYSEGQGLDALPY